ncbi:ornithine cyclodeaminase family protein [Nitratireductor soli]|uniref:ornithine cyclodeaminase family protein n=1 Tax=Nitratireductor soli TaxID=1670619 RepID=UPI0012FC3B04|nr:ornithine cyclodeaminase family protein [Nitratireductor soli]
MIEVLDAVGDTASAVSGEAFSRPVFLSAETVMSVLDWPQVIARMRAIYTVPQGADVSPPRVVARGEAVALRALVAAPADHKFMGAKIFGRGRNRGMEYVLVLIDQENGRIAALVDANPITAFRTAATSAVAVDRLVKTRAPLVVGVLGSGTEARSHIAAIAAVRALKEIRVYSPTRENREAFAAEIGAQLGVSCMAVESGREAIVDADLAIAASRSHDEQPILLGEWLKPGMMVVSVGSTLPEQREADTAAIAACDLIVCDVVDEVRDESGDMIAARRDGVAVDGKLLSLNDLLRGTADIDVDAIRLPMFKSVGAAIQDIAAAELAYDLAVARGLAGEMPIAFQGKS